MIRSLYAMLFFILCGAGLFAQHIEDDPCLLDSLLSRHSGMHFYQSQTVGNADSIWHRAEHFYLYFDTDSICRQFIRKGGYNAIPDEMDYLYFAVFTEMLPERRAVEIAKMEKVAAEYNDEALRREVEYQHVFGLPDDSDEQFEYRINCLRELQQKAEARKDTLMQIRIKEGIHSALRYRYRFPEAMDVAVDIIQMLDEITDEQFAGRRQLYYFIGELFYQYGYNEQAIPLMENALKDADYFFDRANLRARNTLGLYYRNEENMEMSDAYFRSMLESRDMVKYRGVYDAIAISNLGKNCLLRKDFKKAEILLQKALPVMLQFGDYPFSAGICMSLGECYLAERKISEAKTMIDSARLYIEISRVYDLNITLFPLLSNYYAAIGDMETSRAYTDSTARQDQLYRKLYNPSHILQAEKKLYDTEKQLKEKQIKTATLEKLMYRNLLYAFLLIVAIVVGFYVVYARMRTRKNRGLYRQIKEQDRIAEALAKAKTEGAPLPKDEKEADKQDFILRLREQVLSDRYSANPEADIEKLVAALNTNRSYLYKTVKNMTGQTVQDYINTVRLVEARRLLDTSDELIEVVAWMSGFNSARTFYRIFRDRYNMTPTDYRKSKSSSDNIS